MDTGTRMSSTGRSGGVGETGDPFVPVRSNTEERSSILRSRKQNGSGEICLDVEGRIQEHRVPRDRDSSRGTETSETSSLIMARNLLELNKSEYSLLKIAYDDWSRLLESAQKRRVHKESKRDAVRNEIYQVIGFYIVFQGVLVTAVAQSSLLRCHNWWSAFFLSFLFSIITIAVVYQKFQETWALEKTIAEEIRMIRVLKQRITNVTYRIGPKDFVFAEHAPDGTQAKPKSITFTAIVKTSAPFIVLLMFSAFFLASIREILCDPGLEPGSAPGPG